MGVFSSNELSVIYSCVNGELANIQVAIDCHMEPENETEQDKKILRRLYGRAAVLSEILDKMEPLLEN